MPKAIGRSIWENFLGEAPDWYKYTLIGFLVLNPVILLVAGPFPTGWVLLAEVIFTLAMALKCYPLPPSGLLAVQSVLLGMTTPQSIYNETAANLPVLLLLIFMVAGIYFMKELLQFTFTKILLGTRSKRTLSFFFCTIGALFSAFLDALTVVAVVMAVAFGFYDLYHRFASGKQGRAIHDLSDDAEIGEDHQTDLRVFRGFLRNLVMHGAVGTALGGVTTLVGEPQNLLIAHTMGWCFGEFFIRVAPVSIPVLITGLLTCLLLEKLRLFGYGFELPDSVRSILKKQTARDDLNRTAQARARLLIQGATGLLLIVSLAFHLAEVGIIGLMVIILLTAMNGIADERRIGRAFEEALPFTALLVVFFAVIAMIHDLQLFHPVIDFALSLEGRAQLPAYYFANGILSLVSDNVFVATIYVTETAKAFAEGRISREQFDLLAVAINTGTNIASVGTPNGQAAFLFLLTSSLAPLIRLSYGEMVKLALPYTISMTTVGLLAILFLL